MSAPAAAPAASTGLFSTVPAAPPDAILGLNASFRADTSADKVNLGVGAYRTEAGQPYVLPVVRRVEMELAASAASTHEYLPQYGLDDFNRAAVRLLYGEAGAVEQGRVVAVQALSGTGALRVAFEFVRRFGPAGRATEVLLPEPTWSNHRNVVGDADLAVGAYRYFDAETGGVAIETTGADPTMDEWRRIMEVCVSRQLLPLFDNAYQGFASGDLHQDAAAVRMFVDAGIEVMSCQSFAKNAGLYGERIGAFSVVCSDASAVDAIRSQLSRIIRGLYSSPPKHGAAVMAAILQDEKLFAEWQGELVVMSGRIKTMRKLLKDELERIETPGNWDRIINQIGMFSYTGLTSQQVRHMREKYHIYMTSNGRMSMAGLNQSNVAYVAAAMKDALLSVVKQD